MKVKGNRHVPEHDVDITPDQFLARLMDNKLVGCSDIDEGQNPLKGEITIKLGHITITIDDIDAFEFEKVTALIYDELSIPYEPYKKSQTQ